MSVHEKKPYPINGGKYYPQQSERWLFDSFNITVRETVRVEGRVVPELRETELVGRILRSDERSPDITIARLSNGMLAVDEEILDFMVKPQTSNVGKIVRLWPIDSPEPEDISTQEKGIIVRQDADDVMATVIELYDNGELILSKECNYQLCYDETNS